MSFIRHKIHHNKKKEPRIYYFLVKNYRPKGGKTPRQAVIQFLGRYAHNPKLEELKVKFPKLAQQFDEYFERRQKKASKDLSEAEGKLRKVKKDLVELRDEMLKK